MELVLIACGGLLLLELLLRALVRWLRRDFQWLITEADDLPAFDAEALGKFFRTSFDPVLGWVRKPGSQGVEKGKNGDIRFHIDAHGSRAKVLPHVPETVSVFGDSYAFCRQVEDEETWESWLSLLVGLGVGNYGVGNYGADQALLRYEGMVLPDSVRVAVLAFVPETICRIQSRWKHYLEFGNTFAFKPRYELDDTNGLRLAPCPVHGPQDVADLSRLLPDIQARDRFYAEKFRAVQFRGPSYVLRLLQSCGRNLPLLGLLLLRKAARGIGRCDQKLEEAPFALVMRRNLSEAHAQYDDPRATRLFQALLERFARLAASRGHTPLVLVLPQLMDLRAAANSAGVAAYQRFFKEAGTLLPVLDLTDELRQHDFRMLYVNDNYGGHLSAKGNALVAQRVAAWLCDNNVAKAAQK
jgi:hypothetical protein